LFNRYRGKLRDDATGLYYYGYRYYAPWIGNWISPDPLGPVDGLNLYRFVQGDPINKHDPDGRQTTELGGPFPTSEDWAFAKRDAPGAFDLVFDAAVTKGSTLGQGLLSALDACTVVETEAWQMDRPARSAYCRAVAETWDSDSSLLDRGLSVGESTLRAAPMLAEAMTVGSINSSFEQGDRLGDHLAMANIAEMMGDTDAAFGHRVDAFVAGVLGVLPIVDVATLGAGSAATSASGFWARAASQLERASRASSGLVGQARVRARTAVDVAGARLGQGTDAVGARLFPDVGSQPAMAGGPQVSISVGNDARSGNLLMSVEDNLDPFVKTLAAGQTTPLGP